MTLILDNKLRILSAIKDKLLIGPGVIYLDLNNRCNLNCNYCRTHSFLNKKPTCNRPLSLKFNDIKKIVEKAAEWRCKYIAITGHGEPTLNHEFKEIVHYIMEKQLGIELYTNATFNKNLIPLISKIDSVIVNSSVTNEELFNKLISPCNKNMYERIIENVRILNFLNKKYKKPFLQLSFIINATNYKTILKMLELVEEMELRKIFFHWMMPVKDTKKLLLSGKQKLELVKNIDKVLKNNFNFSHNLKIIRSEILNISTDKDSINSPCYVGWFELAVACNKDIGLCCRHENIIIGNLNDNSIEHIWHSKRAQKIRLMYKYQFNLKKYPFKNSCEYCRGHKFFNEEIKKASI
jgi:MoaA/NifB/PqqE/SkfB family radical SAM enzyme